jgi:hypothetical protein
MMLKFGRHNEVRKRYSTDKELVRSEVQVNLTLAIRLG